jgi:hypothetical protein
MRQRRKKKKNAYGGYMGHCSHYGGYIALKEMVRHMGKWRYSSTILDLGARWR